MRVGKISHDRCGDLSGATYVWVPDDMNEEQFEKAVLAAQKHYLADIKAAREDSEAPPCPYRPDWDKADPNTTVGEMRATYEQMKTLRKEWEDKQKVLHTNFGDYLRGAGMLPLWEDKAELKTEVDWGHHHGWSLNYEDTKTDGRPLGEQEEDD